MPELVAWIVALTPFVLIGYVWICAALAALFRKAGVAAWRAWVPVLNLVALLRLGGLRGWWLLFALVPGPGAIALFVLFGVSASRIGRVLGLPRAAVLLAVLVFPLWVSLAGWGHRPYAGAEHPAVRRLRAVEPLAADPLGGHARYVAQAEQPEGPWPFGDTLTDVLGLKRRAGLRSVPPRPAPAAAPDRHAPHPGAAELSSRTDSPRDAPGPDRPPEPPRAPLEPPRVPDDLIVPPRPPLPPVESSSDLDVTVRRRSAAGWILTPRNEHSISLVGDVVILGRRPAADPGHPRAQLVALHDETRTVSKTHARLERHGDAWCVVDLGSTNGVLVIDPDGTEHGVDAGRPEPLEGRLLLGDIELRLDPKPGF